ncbi:hypothetical protein RF11_12278 [Thelohanellus kitauei]|uniref:Tc1-like transposase DDE domain-containing protein n=1 Tax=Thelohanellus kitauei TaxID=669202 RepID=A0A0C2J2R8_THEKT|nr:hypothetical protein RF11_12278 [Thelohanellus kitauei]
MTPKLNEPANRSQKISELVAISISGVVYFFIDVGAINEKSFEYLPPYSPQLIPIEEYFRKSKNSIRRRRTETSTRQQLKDIALKILKTDRGCNMSEYFRHMKTSTEIGFRLDQF